MNGVPGSKSVIVAMSGGVDSSLAAALLHEQGYQAIGVSMQVWDYRRQGGCSSKATCCAPSDFNDARLVAAALGIPFYVFDLEAIFESQVVSKFVQAYANGLTPNPCVECNSKIKFGELRKRAQALGVNSIATGHYARIEKRQGVWHLLRGADPHKDQSYFLYGLTQAELACTLFPVGHLTKAEVRDLAKAKGLSTADKAESQDICFVAGELGDFLEGYGSLGRRGDIIRADGSKIGEHEGIQRFTVGQRHGLGVGGPDGPLYVLEIDPNTARVIVGQKRELERSAFLVEALNWCAPPQSQPKGAFRCTVQLRYRHRGVPAQVELLSNHLVRVNFESDCASDRSAVSPGQAAVFYDVENREVLGGGTICRPDKTASV